MGGGQHDGNINGAAQQVPKFRLQIRQSVHLDLGAEQVTDSEARGQTITAATVDWTSASFQN